MFSPHIDQTSHHPHLVIYSNSREQVFLLGFTVQRTIYSSVAYIKGKYRNLNKDTSMNHGRGQYLELRQEEEETQPSPCALPWDNQGLAKLPFKISGEMSHLPAYNPLIKFISPRRKNLIYHFLSLLDINLIPS